MKDYTINLQDSTGRTHALFISGDCIAEMLAVGHSMTEATEGVQGNAFEVAVRQGLIGSDATVTN